MSGKYVYELAFMQISESDTVSSHCRSASGLKIFTDTFNVV